MKMIFQLYQEKVKGKKRGNRTEIHRKLIFPTNCGMVGTYFSRYFRGDWPKGKEGKTINEERNGWFQQRELEERLNRLSHPYPTVMIDLVTEVEKEKAIRTTKRVSADEFYLTGHFPGEPILPGVLTLEGLIQSALLLVDESFSRGRLKCSLEKVDRVRFKKAVLPGDQVDFQLQLTAKDDNLWKFKGKAQVGKETAAEADIILKVAFRDVGFEV